MMETRRNGTGVPLPINTVQIALDEIGYPGWVATMRINPRSSVYDDLTSFDDMARWWQAFGRVLESWNFADEDGQPFPTPREVDSERDLDLPVGVIGFLYRRYLDEFRASVGLPKASDASSATTSPTSDARESGA